MIGLILAVALWGVVHSVLASFDFKENLRRTFGNGPMKFYRLLYNLFAAISFLPVLYLMTILPDAPFYAVQPPWSYLMLAGMGISALLLLVALIQTDILSFAGWRQLADEEKPGRLVTDGFYRLVRHPLYTFGLLVLWLTPTLTLNTFIVYAALTLYILSGIIFEERKLVREFGQEYENYRRKTPMLIPGLGIGRNK